MNYYNEHEQFAAAWLRELINDGQIPDGKIDDRDLQDVTPSDLDGFNQCHFFAGIGGWSYALKLAGWFGPCWTGSPPCQPFSSAGKQKGTADERHLWPHFFDLIRQCRPPVVFGEQVASAIRHGWLDALQNDMETEGYACGAIVLPACSVGAPHIRQRLFFAAERMGNTERTGLEGRQTAECADKFSSWKGSMDGRLADSEGSVRQYKAKQERRQDNEGRGFNGDGESDRLADSFWGDADWLYCRDGKYRPTKSGVFPLAHGFPNRVGALRGAGNAIVPQVAAEVIKAFMER